jgi:hypothetical protein
MLDGLKIFSTIWVVRLEELGNNSTRLHISFSVPARGVDYRYLPIRGYPMVPVAVAGDATFDRVPQEMTTMEICLEVLKNIGCFVPGFSYYKIKRLGIGKSPWCKLLRGFAGLVKM